MDATDASCFLATAADINKHANLPQRVLFVVGEFVKDFELLAPKLLGPMTLRTSISSRSHILDRCFDWLIKCSERNGIELMHAIELGANVPLGTRTDVAVDTT